MDEIIRVELISDTGFLDFLSNPIITFLLGSLITFFVSFLSDKRNELNSTKEKIAELHFNIKVIKNSFQEMLKFMNPKTRFDTIYVLDEMKSLNSDIAELSREEKDIISIEAKNNLRKHHIQKCIDVIDEKKQLSQTLIEVYIAPQFHIYFNVLFESVDLFQNELQEIKAVIFKRCYSDKEKKLLIDLYEDKILKNIDTAFTDIFSFYQKIHLFGGKRRVVKRNKILIIKEFLSIYEEECKSLT